MTKLLIATDSFLPRWDGIARFLSEVLPGLSKEYEITVLAPNFKGKKIKSKEYRVVRFPIRDWQVADINLTKVSKKDLAVFVSDADIVWVQTVGPIGVKVMRLAKRYKKPVTNFIHSIEWELFSKSLPVPLFVKNWVSLFIKKYVKRIYNQSDVLMVPSVEVSNMFEQIGIKTNKVIVQLGTNIETFKPSFNKANSKKKVGIDPRLTVIGFCGRIGREKDLVTLYRAFSMISKNNKNVFLLIVGGGVHQLEKMLGGMKNVMLTGSVNNVVDYLQAMDIFVLPSLTETTSLATLEAMSCGLAVVSTRVGNIKSYIKNKENGYSFPKGNYHILARKIEFLLMNPSNIGRVGKAARQTVKKEFHWGRTVKEIKQALEKGLKKKK